LLSGVDLSDNTPVLAEIATRGDALGTLLLPEREREREHVSLYTVKEPFRRASLRIYWTSVVDNIVLPAVPT